MGLENLKPPKGSKRNPRRVGRGPGSGRGKTAGRGHKGQKSRSGSGVRPWFEGGQMPLQRRLPKRGFTNIFKKRYVLVNVGTLAALPANTRVDEKLLRDLGLLNRRLDGVKILGRGELSVALTVEAEKFSETARSKIESAGGQVVVTGA
ncbi:MAG: 50S ribosomal protein L15 [Nitrospinota bacterium]|nr:50S ribosomal protein L15 [Nitrospinota bacterium]MDP6483865.1 50S ribosomal protein L15 [Nitrospinota bacterium]MDP6619096.1 50S ribosomal protein L15 [Nitrospinota bacterium]HJM42047.1 50S ribosomal protein L15 [Nitrospinota bacterium]